MPTANFRVTPLSPVIGAEVSGVDLAQPLDAATLAELESAWATHLVLFFREQDLSFEQHKSLGRRFGELHIHPAAPKDAEHPEVLDTLAAAYAAEGRFDDAVATAQKAAAAARVTPGYESTATAIDERIDLYILFKPYRIP